MLLATALVSAMDAFGRLITLRTLIDSGSQGSIITEKAAELLQLQSIPTLNYVSCLGGKDTGKTRLITINVQSRMENSFNLEVDCYILKKVTKPLPDYEINTKGWKHLKGLTLADPTFHKVGPIDIWAQMWLQTS